MRAYKVELLIIDHDELGENGIITELENARFSNDCISPHIMKIEKAEIGNWHDDHPLNKFDLMKLEYERIFN